MHLRRGAAPSRVVDGFSYRKGDRYANGTTRMRCSKRGCNGALLVMCDGSVVKKGIHNHEATVKLEKIVAVCPFKNVLTTRAATDVHTDMRRIYIDEKEK